ncbi:MAG: hypothetical protein AAF329_26990, partial [Cyanobacteria bacterium P01_A01_bin.17]
MQRAQWQRWGKVLGLFAIALSLTLIACNNIAPPTEPGPAAAPASPDPIPEPIASAQPPAPQVSIERLMEHMEALNHERFTEGDRQRARDYASEVL